MSSYTHRDLDNELQAFRSALQTLAERYSTMFLNMASNEPIVRVTSPHDISSLSSAVTPSPEGQSVDQVLREACQIYDYRMRTNHPRFLAFIPSPASPLSVLGECIASSFNTFANCKLEGSGPSVVEKELVKWMAESIGWDGDRAGGVFVSGGSIANLTSIAVARDQKLPMGKHGLGVAYVSDQTHGSVAKALRILGFANSQVRKLETDGDLRMTAASLAKAISADKKAELIPFVVIATCGTTNTGSIDELSAIGAVCRNEGVWMHIDGAYGASVALSASHSHLAQGLELGDSVAWDAHKWLFQTYGCGVTLVKDKKHLLESFATDADYLRDITEEEDVPNFWNYGIELTRPARAMKLWFTVRVLGTGKLGMMIDHGFALAEVAEAELRKREHWEIVTGASLAIVTFRCKPPHLTEDTVNALNTVLSRRLLAENVAGILTTEVRKKVVLRICAINPHLTCEEMAKVVEDMDCMARSVWPTVG